MDSQSGEIGRTIAAWGRIENWLQSFAPASAALLRPPAGEGDLAAARAAMGVELPPALAAWYGLCDGVEEGAAPVGSVEVAGILPSGKAMLPLEQLVSEYRTRTRDWEREAGVLPFARTAGDTWYGWYVDGRKAESTYGNLGRWSVDGGDERYPSSSNGWPLGAWLTEVAAALEQGRPMRHPDGSEVVWDRPALYRDGLTWVDGRDLRIDAVLLDGPS